MAKGYQTREIKKKLINVLKDAKTSLSGVEIAGKLGINRITMMKYLNVFAAEGLIRQRNVGNVTLWSVEEGIEQLQFPDDYFKVKTKFLENLVEASENQVYSLIRNCLHSDADISKLTTEIIVPAIESVQKLYKDGKIGNSEEKMISNIIANSIQILYLVTTEANPKKNVIVLSADSKNTLLAQAASASFHSQGWQVSYLGDMSSAIDVLFDLDLQKFLGKVWKQETGIMIVVVFSESEEGLNFFADTVNSLKGKLGKNLYLVLCGMIGKKITIKADLVSEKLESVFQWSETIFQSSET